MKVKCKTFILVFLLGILLVAVGCGGNEDPSEVEVENVTITGNTELNVGETIQLSVTILPADAEGKTVVWSSENDAIATVDQTGKVTGVAEGSTTIKAKVDEVEASVTVTVKVPTLTKLTIKGEDTVVAGNTIELTVETEPAGAVVDVKWSVNDTSIASISNGGTLRAYKAGTVTVTAKSGEIEATKSIQVLGPNVSTVTISGEDTVHAGETLQLTATVLPADAEDKTVVWRSENDAIATVDQTGLVTGVEKGTVKIYAKAGDVETSKEIKVTQEYAIVYQTNGGTNDPDNKTIFQKGDKLTFKPATKPGYTFLGWFEDNDCSGNPIDGFDEAPDRDITLYAGWEIIDYAITYQLDNGTNSNKNPETYNVSQLPLQLAQPTRDGFTFAGWKLNDEVIDSIPTGTTGAITLVATWEALAPGEYNVQYHFDGGYSNELLAENAEGALTFKVDNYNQTGGSFWGGNYATDVFICEKSKFENATFSDRIYLKKNEYTGLYEVAKIVRTGGEAWPDGAEYAIIISNSYNNYYAAMQPITQLIEVGQTVVITKDIPSISKDNPADVYFFDTLPDADQLNIIANSSTKIIEPSRLGYEFLGWYDETETKWESFENINKSLTLTARWNELNPVVDIKVDSICDELLTGGTHQIVASVLPADAFFKSLFYSSSNTDILKVSETGEITAVNAGKAIITIRDYVGKKTYTKEITVYSKDTIDVKFAGEFHGVLKPEETVQINAKAFGKGRENAELTFETSTNTIINVSSTGLVTAKSEGTGVVDIKIKDAPTVTVKVSIVVMNLQETNPIDRLLALFIQNNYAVVESGNISLYDDGTLKVYVPTYGSVNRYLFDEFKVNEQYYANTESNSNNHKARRAADTIEFVTVHDTATLTGTVENIASNMSTYPNETSIHYTVGNDKIYGVVPEKYIAYHAGDGTSAIFEWVKTNAPATEDVRPTYDVVQSGSSYVLSVNGVATTVNVPLVNGSRIPTKADLTRLGPVWKVEDGVYWIGGPLWSSSSSYNQVGSRGGNTNSIGIEMCSNRGGDIYDTFQRTARLVADILIRNNLPTSRVKMHNTWSGKNCPQTIIAGNYWSEFMKMVEMQYTIQTEYKDAKISITSLAPNTIDETGRVINNPEVTTSVSYYLTIELGGQQRSITLYNIVPGTTTWEQWDGTYSTSKIWNNGNYSLSVAE